MSSPEAARVLVARAEIQSIYGKPKGENSVTLFVSHHLDELDSEEWLDCIGVAKPRPEDILNSLVLETAWSSEDDGTIDMYDFTLPKNMTQYVIAVRFAGDTIVDIDMES